MSTGARSQKNGAYFQAIVPGSSWSMSFTNASALGLDLDTDTTILRLVPTQDCWVLVGPAPVAVIPTIGGPKVAGAVRVNAGALAYIGVEYGWKVAVIRDSADGVLNVTEGA